jgi:hypothetical protein
VEEQGSTQSNPGSCGHIETPDRVPCTLRAALARGGLQAGQYVTRAILTRLDRNFRFGKEAWDRTERAGAPGRTKDPMRF